MHGTTVGVVLLSIVRDLRCGAGVLVRQPTFSAGGRPVTIVLVVGVIAVVGVTASVVRMRQATQVDPIMALRHDHACSVGAGRRSERA